MKEWRSPRKIQGSGTESCAAADWRWSDRWEEGWKKEREKKGWRWYYSSVNSLHGPTSLIQFKIWTPEQISKENLQAKRSERIWNLTLQVAGFETPLVWLGWEIRISSEKRLTSAVKFDEIIVIASASYLWSWLLFAKRPSFRLHFPSSLRCENTALRRDVGCARRDAKTTRFAQLDLRATLLSDPQPRR